MVNITEDEELKEVLYQLIKSNYILGMAEYNRNGKYNCEHFHYKAEEGIMNYLKKNDNKFFQYVIDRLILEKY